MSLSCMDQRFMSDLTLSSHRFRVRKAKKKQKKKQHTQDDSTRIIITAIIMAENKP